MFSNCMQCFSGILFLCITIIFSQQYASAQPEPGPESGRGPVAMKRGRSAMFGADYRLELMTRNLGLTAEQQAKIKPILAEESSRMEELRGNDRYNRDERRARLQELNKQTNEIIKPILTQEQQSKYEEVKQKITRNRSKTRSTRPGPNPGENDPDSRMKRLTDDLGLTSEQQASIRPIVAAEFTGLEALRGNDTYNREQRRSRLLQLNTETYAKIKPLLTPEQLKKYVAIEDKIIDRRTQTKKQSGK